MFKLIPLIITLFLLLTLLYEINSRKLRRPSSSPLLLDNIDHLNDVKIDYFDNTTNDAGNDVQSIDSNHERHGFGMVVALLAPLAIDLVSNVVSEIIDQPKKAAAAATTTTARPTMSSIEMKQMMLIDELKKEQDDLLQELKIKTMEYDKLYMFYRDEQQNDHNGDHMINDGINPVQAINDIREMIETQNESYNPRSDRQQTINKYRSVNKHLKNMIKKLDLKIALLKTLNNERKMTRKLQQKLIN